MGAAHSRLLPERESLSLASLPENVLMEIFSRLPAHPAFLRCISLTCKEFHQIVVNPDFLRLFRAHHGDTPPLVGFIRNQSPRFLPTIGGAVVQYDPDRVVAGAGALELDDADWIVLGCRHGRVLLQCPDRLYLLVVDPMAGRREYIDAPLWYRLRHSSTAVLICSPAGHGDHGDCRSRPFSIVFVYFSVAFMTSISIYSSQTDQWVKIQTPMLPGPLPLPYPIDTSRPSVLIGNVLYMFTIFTTVLCFNVDTHERHEIPQPPGNHYIERRAVLRVNTLLVAPRDASLGFVSVTSWYLKLWVSNFADGVHLQWTPRWFVALDTLVPFPEDISQPTQMPKIRIIGHDEDGSVVYLWSLAGVFAIHLDEMQSHQVFSNYQLIHRVYPYKSFFFPPDLEEDCEDQEYEDVTDREVEGIHGNVGFSDDTGN
ncbi:hypothetical protein QOZ80_2BG0172790 [Eleusine coracana subsp. coracana]|nr:hypothetical protein QOZ80_2BG0172790 [Eleusine coracana subsp. coracana]